MIKGRPEAEKYPIRQYDDDNENEKVTELTRRPGVRNRSWVS